MWSNNDGNGRRGFFWLPITYQFQGKGRGIAPTAKGVSAVDERRGVKNAPFGGDSKSILVDVNPPSADDPAPSCSLWRLVCFHLYLFSTHRSSNPFSSSLRSKTKPCSLDGCLGYGKPVDVVVQVCRAGKLFLTRCTARQLRLRRATPTGKGVFGGRVA
jgi:hypothetical protein